jgi:nucleotide-binding universal stress UspA family protein
MTTTATTAPPVVVATDGTSSSEGALRYAVQEATTRRTGLRIVHVSPMAMPVPPLRPVQPVDLEPYARTVLTRTSMEIRKQAPGLAVSTELGHGSRVGGIVEASKDAQLVVVGRETRNGLDRMLTGATTAGVASHARCPVVAVAGDWHPRTGSDVGGRVVVGVRRESDGPDLMATAYAWASSHGASITVVHAWEMSDEHIDRIEARTNADEWQARGTQLLDEVLDDWRDVHPHVAVDTRVVHGQAAKVLMAAAKAADLLVVRRAHEQRPFDHLGSTVRALLLASRTPVEVVPAHHVPPDPDLELERAGHLAR